MPRGNGTGPRGMGPMTGRGAGFCVGYDRPGHMNAMGCRHGSGFGWRNQFYAAGMPARARGNPVAPAAAADELAALKGQADCLGAELEQIQARIRELETRKDHA